MQNKKYNVFNNLLLLNFKGFKSIIPQSILSLIFSLKERNIIICILCCIQDRPQNSSLGSGAPCWINLAFSWYPGPRISMTFARYSLIIR